MLKKFFFATFGAALLNHSIPVRAQAPQVPPALKTSIEGTLSAIRDGVELRADLKFQRPDSLRIDLQPNTGALVAAQTVIASGNQTLLFDPQTRRVRRLAFNVVKQPWRSTALGWAGAANIAFFGLDPTLTAIAYQQKGGANSLSLDAKTDAGHLVRDYVRSGGDRQALFYAVYKRRVWDFPRRLQLTLNNGLVSSQTELDSNDKATATTTIEYSPTNLPLKATIRDSQSRIVTEIRYDLKPREGEFPAGTFSLGAVEKEAIFEDVELSNIAAYSGRGDAASQYNLGIALARHTEDYATALGMWSKAAAQQPQATAPHFATWQTALTSRNLGLAATALERLTQLLGADNLTVLSYRANLATLRRDWPAAAATLESAQKAAPQDLTIALLLSEMLRLQGKLTEARAVLLDILKSDLPLPATQAAAAEALASSAWSEAEAQQVLAVIPNDTQWQKLARLHIALWQGQNPEPQGITAPLAQASLAAAYEREKNDDAAIKLWQDVEAGSETAAIVARQHLELLGARRGDAALSLRNFRALSLAAVDEATRQRETDFLREGWRKNFRQAELRAALQSRAISAGAGEVDLKAWLTYLDSEGTRDEIGAAVRSAVAGFDKYAFWHSRYAEQLLIERQALKGDQDQGRANLFKEARQEMERAIELDPDQPYYAMQLALSALQRYGEKSPIINVNEELEKRDNAVEALNKLERAWPEDPDVALLVALGRKDLAHGSAESIVAIAQALAGGRPGRETMSGEQHTTAFFARQAIALAWRKLKKWPEAEREYQALLLSSQSAVEELGLGINYIAMQGEKAGKGRTPDLEPVALFLERAVSEPWSYGDSQMMLQNYIPLLVPNRPLSAELAGLLVKGNAARKVAGAQLLYEIEKLAEQEAIAPDAPPATERFLRQTQALAATATEALKEIGGGPDKLVASRALSLLAERSLAGGNAAEATSYLTSAIAIEPREIALRIALVRALWLAAQRAEAAAARDDILRILPRDGETLRQAAQISHFIGQDKEALRLAGMAQHSLQTARTPSPAQVQSATFVLARALFDNDRSEDAGKAYQQLAGEQWSTTERAAALLDWEARLRATGQDAEAESVKRRLDDLKAKPRELQQAKGLLEKFE